MLTRGPFRRSSRRFPSIAHCGALASAVVDLSAATERILTHFKSWNRRRQLFTGREQDRNEGPSYSRRTSPLLNPHTFG